MTKIMIVGSWSWPIYEESFSRALTSHGASIYPFSTSKFFQGSIGQKLTAIPIPSFPLFQLNCALVKEAQLVQPDWILFWRPTHILPRTLQKLRRLRFKLASYNNDDPFGPSIHGNVPYHHHYLWSHYLKCLLSSTRISFIGKLIAMKLFPTVLNIQHYCCHTLSLGEISL